MGLACLFCHVYCESDIKLHHPPNHMLSSNNYQNPSCPLLSAPKLSGTRQPLVNILGNSKSLLHLLDTCMTGCQRTFERPHPNHFHGSDRLKMELQQQFLLTNLSPWLHYHSEVYHSYPATESKSSKRLKL